MFIQFIRQLNLLRLDFICTFSNCETAPEGLFKHSQPYPASDSVHKPKTKSYIWVS